LIGRAFVNFQKVKLANSLTCDQLIAEHEECHTHRDVFRFFKRTSMGYPGPVDPNKGSLPSLCEQDTEEPIPQIEGAMQNLIPLSVPDVMDHALQFRSERFHEGITFLPKAKCYQQINSLTCKRIAEFCRS
jgi:hypothetical protein